MFFPQIFLQRNFLLKISPVTTLYVFAWKFKIKFLQLRTNLIIFLRAHIMTLRRIRIGQQHSKLPIGGELLKRLTNFDEILFGL